jgi:serine phosphatase RsbU (regulator of sigma subunit)
MKLYILIFSFTFLLLNAVVAQDQAAIDSLLQVVSASGEDTTEIRALIELGDQYRYVQPDTAYIYYKEALEISTRLNDLNYKAHCLRCLGMVKENQGFYDKALEEYFKALKIFEELGHNPGLASTYNDIAIIHYLQGSSELCMEYLTLSYEIKKDLGDTEGMASYYTNMSALNKTLGRYEEALEFTENSIDLHKELGDQAGIAVGYGNIGAIQYELRNYQAALENHLKSVEMHEEINNKDGIVHSLSNVAGTYLQMADSVAQTEAQRLKYLNQAVSYGLRCYALAEEMDALFIQNYAANTLQGAYKALGDPWKALEYAQVYINTRDSLFNEEKTRAIEEMDTKYETEKKQQQIELQESQIIARDATIKQQKTFRNALGTGFLALILIAAVIIYAYVQKRKDNRKISEQNHQLTEAYEELSVLNEAISKQNAQITEANEELTVLNESINQQKNEIIDSISYAQRIQAAMLPPESYINELLIENFILYKPRDIVSGDFYWVKQVNQYIVLAAADCTGHGVPGALMSMLGISFLNEIVQRREITQANQVLNELRNQIKRSLRQRGQPDESKDGIDMALCVIDMKNKMMQYAGANNPLYLIRDEEDTPKLQEIKADRMPLGYYQGKDSTFTNHDIPIKTGDTIYIFSDGYIDQKGGKEKKKFMSKNFKNLLLEIYEQSLPDQRSLLEKRLENWMENQDQMDDILVIGLRL